MKIVTRRSTLIFFFVQKGVFKFAATSYVPQVPTDRVPTRLLKAYLKFLPRLEETLTSVIIEPVVTDAKVKINRIIQRARKKNVLGECIRLFYPLFTIKITTSVDCHFQRRVVVVFFIFGRVVFVFEYCF